MLIEALPHVAYRDNLQLASFMAAVLNMMGGKADPDDKEAKTVPLERMYSADEMLVWFAQTPKASVWTRDAARVALEFRDRVPKWVRESLPWKELKSLVS